MHPERTGSIAAVRAHPSPVLASLVKSVVKGKSVMPELTVPEVTVMMPAKPVVMTPR